jgi:hypothetical protein
MLMLLQHALPFTAHSSISTVFGFIAVRSVFHNTSIAIMPGLFTGVRKKIKKSFQTLLRFFADTHRSRPPTRRTLFLFREGRLAQLVERLVYTEDVGSSSLSSPTIYSIFLK